MGAMGRVQPDDSSYLPHPAFPARRTVFARSRGYAMLAPSSLIWSLQDIEWSYSYGGLGADTSGARRGLPSHFGIPNTFRIVPMIPITSSVTETPRIAHRSHSIPSRLRWPI